MYKRMLHFWSYAIVKKKKEKKGRYSIYFQQNVYFLHEQKTERKNKVLIMKSANFQPNLFKQK